MTIARRRTDAKIAIVTQVGNSGKVGAGLDFWSSLIKTDLIEFLRAAGAYIFHLHQVVCSPYDVNCVVCVCNEKILGFN